MTEPKDSEYRASYLEFSRPEFLQKYPEILKGLVPEGYDIGSEDRVGDLAFRYITLPQDQTEREKRIQEIIEAGTDRTDPNIDDGMNWYQETAYKEGLDPLNIMDCIQDMTFHQWTKAGRVTTFGGNAILVFDKKSPFGVREIDVAEWTFKDLLHKREALLAIIGLK